MAASAAYIQHISSQIQQNVEFLVQQGAITQADAVAIASRLPGGTQAGGMDSTVTAQMNRLQIAPPTAEAQPSGPGGFRRTLAPPPPPPARAAQQAKAIWAYNEGGSVSLNILLCNDASAHTNYRIRKTFLLVQEI